MQGERTGALQHSRKVLCCHPCSHASHQVLTGCEGGALTLWDTRKCAAPLARVAGAHSARIRGIASGRLAPDSDSSGSDSERADGESDMQQVVKAAQDEQSTRSNPASRKRGRDAAATASSDGSVKLWDLRDLAAAGSHAARAAAADQLQAAEGDIDAVLQPLAALHVGARFTGLCAVHSSKTTGGDGAAAATGAAATASGDGHHAKARKRRKQRHDQSHAQPRSAQRASVAAQHPAAAAVQADARVDAQPSVPGSKNRHQKRAGNDGVAQQTAPKAKKHKHERSQHQDTAADGTPATQQGGSQGPSLSKAQRSAKVKQKHKRKHDGLQSELANISQASGAPHKSKERKRMKRSEP